MRGNLRDEEILRLSLAPQTTRDGPMTHVRIHTEYGSRLADGRVIYPLTLKRPPAPGFNVNVEADNPMLAIERAVRDLRAKETLT